MNGGMNRPVNKAAAALAFLAVSLCAGCNGNVAQTKTTTTAALSLIADDDTSEDDVLLDDSEDYDVEYGEWEVDEIGEVIEDVSGVDVESGETERDETENDEDEKRPDKSAELIGVLQTNGQVIYSDEFCQIRYFGETKDDNGDLIYVLGYKKFHGGLIRFNKADFKLGSAVDFIYPLWFAPMNELTDGYLCMSGAHGNDYYYDKPEEKWWTDNEYIYLCCPKAPGNEEKIWSSYSYTDGEFVKYDDSVYDGISTLTLYFGELVIQEGVSGDADGNAPRFDEATDENTHRCAIDLSSPVIRVRFDPEKVDLWAHT